MGTITAQMLIGHSHPNDGGIDPTHYMYLDEGNATFWILVSQNLYPSGNHLPMVITWITTPENSLEDGMLMIATHVLKNQRVVELAKSFNSAITDGWFDLYYGLTELQRRRLYEKSRQLSDFPKVIISTFLNSILTNQLPVIQNYLADVEICPVQYSRLFDRWQNKTYITGSLEKITERTEADRKSVKMARGRTG